MHDFFSFLNQPRQSSFSQNRRSSTLTLRFSSESLKYSRVEYRAQQREKSVNHRVRITTAKEIKF